MLFESYPEIQYKIGSLDVTIVDISKNVVFTNVENSNSYYDYYIQDGETPEDVSAKAYGTTTYAWLILMVNNISDLKRDWFVSQTEFNKIKEANYGGTAYYIQAIPDIKPGDIMVKVTNTSSNVATAVNANVYCHIADFDPYFRKIRGINGFGSFTGGDNILFARKDENGSVVPLTFLDNSLDPVETNYTPLLFKEKYGQSISYFYTSNNVIINPYKIKATGITGVNTNTIYTNPNDSTTVNNFANTIIYKYGKSGGPPETGLFKKQIDADLFSKYITRQKIKVLRPELLNVVVTEIKNILESNNVGRQIKIEL